MLVVKFLPIPAKFSKNLKSTFKLFFFSGAWHAKKNKIDRQTLLFNRDGFKLHYYGSKQNKFWPNRKNRADHMILHMQYFFCLAANILCSPLLFGFLYNNTKRQMYSSQFLTPLPSPNGWKFCLQLWNRIFYIIFEDFMSWMVSKLHIRFKSYGHLAEFECTSGFMSNLF